MSVVDLKEQLNNLIKLQEVDTEIHNFRAEKEAKPHEFKALEAALEEKKQSLANLEKALFDFQKLKKERELELGSREESTKKLQTQLYSLKTNKEYQIMLQQIADSKADASVIEDKILEVMEQIDKGQIDISTEKQKLREEENNFNAGKKNIENRIKEIDDELAKLEVKRKEILPSITENILAQYNRILENRDGLAIVKVKNNSCSGCNMFTPPQVINLIRMYERIVTCEVCNRILFTEDENEAV